jgi:hypothetical protein
VLPTVPIKPSRIFMPLAEAPRLPRQDYRRRDSGRKPRERVFGTAGMRDHSARYFRGAGIALERGSLE